MRKSNPRTDHAKAGADRPVAVAAADRALTNAAADRRLASAAGDRAVAKAAGRPLALAAAGLLAVAAGAAPLPAAAEAGGEAFVRQASDAELQWGPCPDFLPEGCRIAVLQGDPAEPNADIFFRLPGGATAERHWHHSAERMVLVEGELSVDYDGQEPVVLRPGTYAYGPAELPHSAACLSAEPCVLFIAFEEPVDAMAGAPD